MPEWPGTPEQPQQQWPGQKIAPGSAAAPGDLQNLMEQPLVKEGERRLAQRDADIDYSTGAPVATRMLLQRASNPEEAKLVLNKSVGEGNYGQDRFGQWWVKQNDKKVAVLPKGIIGGLENAATGMASSPAATGGAIAGGVLGEAVFPAGGGIPGAAIGAMAGVGLDDLTKWAQGLFAQKPAEVVHSMAGEGALAAGFQGAGPALSKVGQGIRGGLQRFTGVTPTTRVMAQETAGGGAVPPIGSYAPGATSIEYKRQLRNALAGTHESEAKNIEYLDTRTRQIFANEGIQPAEITRMMEEIKNTSYMLSRTEAGTAVTEKAHQIHADLLRGYAEARQMAEKLLQGGDALLRKQAAAPPLLGQDVSQAIVEQRRAFSKQMSGVYKSIDRMTGNTAVVPTQLINAEARQLVKIMPPNSVPPLLAQWAGKVPKKITFEQAHALRTTLREMGEIIDVSPLGIKLGNVRKMSGAVDAAMNSTSDEVGQQAAGLLKQADAQYAEGIRKYNNIQINKLVRDLRSGIVPEPETTARLIMDPGNTELASTVFKMLPQNVRDGVIRADLKGMINTATYRTDNNQLLMDGKTFLKQLDQRAGLMAKTYPAAMIKQLREYAEQLGAFNGQIDVNSIKASTAITRALQNAVGSMRAADEFAKSNPLGALVSGTPVQIDRALARITAPGNEAVTEQVAKTLGIDSPQWRSVRKYAMQNVLAQAVEEKRSLAKTVSGGKIDLQLNQYTRRQQELLFPHGLADDLRLLGKEAKFLFPSSAQQDLGTSLAAASIKGHLWLNPLAVWKYIRLNVMGYIADHPRLVKFLAGEIKKNPIYARSTLSVIGQYAVERAIMGGPGKGRPGPDVEPPQPQRQDIREVQYGGPQQ